MNAIDIDSLQPIITAKAVAADRRFRMQPHYFKQYFMKTENWIYVMMEKISPSYNGGYWDFFELSNGGFYMAPKPAANGARIQIEVPFGNGYEGEMSADAAGILACVLAYGLMAERTQDDLFFNLHTKLVDYVYRHSEADELCRAMD